MDPAPRLTCLPTTSQSRVARLGKHRSPGPADAGKTLADVLDDAPATLTKTAAAPVRAEVIIPQFVDDAQSAGLNFVFDNGRSPQRQIPETTAGGVGLLDYDGDGWLDVYVVQGGALPARSGRPYHGRPALSQPGRRHV